ncbi:unnamed protein product [Oppiella nova]|uniref:Protein-tyrosine-phosphatase n=1 Tax=Oppiella nova TaxID=334625 RepID=A0A7R9LJX5_9ACAR|nr:unnamed protein product [Oppiella nova]CAG2164374.1 unnamed protein product [Oppiella nova]
MPSDVPNQILDMKVLAATNETLLIGWKRPHDNGALISEYRMELRNVEQSSVIGETMIVKDTQHEIRRNYMYIFVGLEPATKYSFQVRACSYLGCGKWSEPQLSAQTSDGNSEAPLNLRVVCAFDGRRSANFANISWTQSSNTRGTVVGYNVTVVGSARYRNSNDQIVTDHIVEWHRIHSNTTHQIQLPLKANTNYTVQLCAINLSGCGTWTPIDSHSKCSTGPHLQHNFPGIRFETTGSIGELKMVFPRVSERFGLVTCYRVFVVKLPFGYTLSDLSPYKPSELNLTSYAKVHYHQVFKPQAYIADEIPSLEFNNEVIIGDRKYTSCMDAGKDNLVLNGPEEELMSNTSELIDDGPLAELTNYTGFVEIHVLGANGVILRKQSTYLSPIQTSSSPLLSMPTSTNSVSPLLSSIGNPSTTTILLCLISGIAIILLIIILILWLLIRRNNESNSGGHTVSSRQTHDKLNSIQRSKHVHSNGIVMNGVLPAQTLHGSQVSAHSSDRDCIPVAVIHLINLPQIYRERSAQNNRLFELEFNSLPKSFDDRTSRTAEAEANVTKNRFPSVKCFDETRVRLSLVDGQPNTDYINANFVAYNQKLYICCEGPIESTVKDFWRMIYECESSVIVMLTGCEEQGLEKCAQYWSDDGVKTIDNQFAVSVQSVRIYSDYIIRRFQLSTIDHKYSRDVLQFHYMMWKDVSPSELLPSGILRLMKHVNENYCPDRGPIVVHCCSGLGRSATYIAIDSLLPEIISGFVNIYDCVLNIRYQRNQSIQTPDQYVFIYKALLEFAIFGDTEVDIEHFETYYQQIIEEQIDNVNLLNTQFDRLEFTLGDPKSCECGLLPENIDKNRFNHGYDRYLTFIATQDPLESTLKDFVCMVYEENVSVIVMLSEASDVCYWPSTESTYGNYSIKLMNRRSEQSSRHISALELQVSKLSSYVTDSGAHGVTVYQLCGWSDAIIPETTMALIELCETVLNESQTKSPILVQCCNGSQRCCLFIALLSLIQQIKVDKRVDVFQTARATKMQRCSAFQRFEEYAFLYTALMDYIVSRNLCDTSDVVL